MSVIIIVLSIIFVSASVAYFVYSYSRKKFIKRELGDIIAKCSEIESKMERGFARFDPIKEERYLYDMLVAAGVMRVNPIGGYSFTSVTSRALDLVDGKEIITPKFKEGEVDNVLVSGKDKDGKVIPLIIEKDGKPVNAATGEILKPGVPPSGKIG